MGNFCVCIGVDGYKDPAWQLGSCVNDAVAFADWALAAGGVAPADLRMFLSPTNRGLADKVRLPRSNVEVPCAAGTRSNIIGFILTEMRTHGWGGDGERLYWYFAGHGCSHESVRGTRAEPVLFPADVEKLPIDANNLIGFTDILEPLRFCGPPRQLFFLDACRDFALTNYAVSAGAAPGRFFRRLPESGGRDPNRQYVLYATATGERAVELKQGIFAEYLLRGLSGDPGALLRRAGVGDYQLTYNRLTSFIREEVRNKVQRVLFARRDRPVQIPEVDVDPGEPDFAMAVIPEGQVPLCDLYVRVRPQTALANCCVTTYYETNIVPPVCGPPLEGMTKLSLRPSYYRVAASAPGMAEATKTIQVPKDALIELELTQAPSAVAAAAKHLRFFSRDRSHLVNVWDTEGQWRTQLQEVFYNDPKPGLYRAMVLNPERPSTPQGYSFPDCGSEVELDVPPIAISSVQMTALENIGLAATGNTITSELLGPLSDVKVVSLLGFAAYASYVQREGAISPLRQFGLAPLEPDDRSRAWATVLIGATGYEPAPNTSVANFLTKARVALVTHDKTVTHELTILPGFSTAGQALFQCPQGTFAIELRLPELPVVRYSMVGMPGRMAVLAITVSDEQKVEAQEYLFSFELANFLPEELPILERAQRFYAANRPIPEPIIDRLLLTKAIDPLQASLAGYALARARKHEVFVGAFRPGDPNWNPKSPMQNMLNFFDALPDTHVLAGLCHRENRSDHYRKALERGIPLFSDGFRALIDHFGSDSGTVFPAAARRAMRTLVPGSLFSAWMSWEPVIGISDSGFEPPPTNWIAIEKRRSVVEKRSASCGQIIRREQDGTYTPVGSGFLVAPDLILTANHMIALPGHSPPAGATFFFTTDIDPSSGTALRAATTVALDHDARLALLRLEMPLPDVTPVPIASAETVVLPEQSIYVVGYPQRSLLSDAGLVRQLFPGKFGTKTLQPGMILAAPASERSFDHDASTFVGNGGSPVIDLDSGVAIGVHWGGMEEAGQKRNRATKLTHAANRGLLSHLPAPP